VWFLPSFLRSFALSQLHQVLQISNFSLYVLLLSTTTYFEKSSYSKADMSLEEGMALVHRRRPQAQPIPAFIEILEQYEKELIISNNKKRESANGREKEQSRQDTTKRRRVVGPSIGPSIGPAGPPPIGPQKPSVDDSVESPSKESTNTPAIGPSLLPNTTSEQNKLIGPAMPPPKEQVRNSKPETAIGPAMPPKKGLL
jgi:hypothetical protein